MIDNGVWSRYIFQQTDAILESASREGAVQHLCLEDQVALLEKEHTDIDQAIRSHERSLLAYSAAGRVTIQRLKQQKLRLKERIVQLRKAIDQAVIA